MKKKILIVLIAILSAGAIACGAIGVYFQKRNDEKPSTQGKDVVVTIITSYDEGINGKFILTVNEDGNVVNEISYVCEENSFIESYKFEYEYNADGDETKRIGYYWDEDDWKFETKREVSQITENDILYITETLYVYEDEWKISYKAVEGYDSQGRDSFYEYFSEGVQERYTYDYSDVSKAIMYDYSWDQSLNGGEGDWVLCGKCERVTEGGTTTATYYNKEEESWVDINMSTIDTVTYDNKGNVLTESNLNIELNNSYGIKSIYTYNSNNKRILEIYQSWDDDDWVTFNKAEISYNEKGKEHLYKEYSLNNSEWDLSSVTSFEYDKNNRITKRNITYYYNGEDDGFQNLEISYSNNNYYEIDFDRPIFD